MEEITSFEKKINLGLSMNIFDEFYLINSQNKLIDKNVKLEQSKNPKITVVMTVYNNENNLLRCLRSIQNQSLKNIEIIIVDDCSTDNSVELIKQYQKEDPRIILIEHESNESPIKSRSDGIRMAKGKYITLIDGDDAFLHQDILKNSLYIAQTGDIDVIEFNYAKYNDKGFVEVAQFYYDLNLTNILYQPELSNKFINTNKYFRGGFSNRAIWGKLVRNEIFKKVLEYIGVEYENEYITLAEDTIMTIALFRSANSYYFIKELGYHYNIGKKGKNIVAKNKVCKPNNKIKDFSFFKFLKFLVTKAGKDEKNQIMAYREMTLGVNYKKYLKKCKMGKKHYEIIYFIFDKILEFEFLNKERKDNIIRLRNKFFKKKNIEKIKHF